MALTSQACPWDFPTGPDFIIHAPSSTFLHPAPCLPSPTYYQKQRDMATAQVAFPAGDTVVSLEEET